MEPELKKISPEVFRYIGNEILPKYKQLKGHTDTHITDVIRRSLRIAEGLDDINLDMVYVIAAYHDLGRLVDNETHHLESAKMLRADEMLKSFFAPEEIIIMSEAVEDHRASLKRDPRSVYGKIVSSADRSCDVAEILARAYDYNKTLYPELPEKDTIENVRVVLRKKYTPGGYASKKMYFKNPEFESFLKEVEDITATPEKFYEVQAEFNRKRFGKADLVVFGASRKGYEIAMERFGSEYKVLRVDPDALPEAKESYRELITNKTPIMVFGPVGSNTIPIGTEVYITESHLNQSTQGSLVANLDKPQLENAPTCGVPCYTSEVFVTETDIKEPVVFDRVLAFLIQDGFNVVSSWRIVSDNLSKEQFEKFKKCA